MPGKVVRAYEKNTVLVAGAASKSGGTLQIVLASNLDVSGFVFTGILFRMHAFTVGAGGMGTAPSAFISLFNSAPSDEDPVTLFRQGWPGGAPAITGGSISYASPFVPTLDFKAGPSFATGSMVDVILNVTQYATNVADLTLTISVDLILKS